MLRPLLRRAALLLFVPLAANAAGYIITALLNDLWPRQVAFLSPDTPPLTLGGAVAQYVSYLGDLLKGNPGDLLSTGSAGQYFVEVVPKSLILLGLALIVSAVLGIALGLISINPHTRQIGALPLVTSLAGFSMPGFYLAIIVIYLLLTTGIGRTNGGGMLLPVAGYGLDARLVLPVLALALRPTAEIARLTAETLAEELPKPYIRTARAKGLPWRLVVLRHAFRNVIVTVIVALGNSLRYLISSLVVIEWLFQWPGVGRALITTMLPNAIFTEAFDAPLVAGLLAIIAVVFIVVHLISEMAILALDPRLRRAAADL